MSQDSLFKRRGSPSNVTVASGALGCAKAPPQAGFSLTLAPNPGRCLGPPICRSNSNIPAPICGQWDLGRMCLRTHPCLAPDWPPAVPPAGAGGWEEGQIRHSFQPLGHTGVRVLSEPRPTVCDGPRLGWWTSISSLDNMENVLGILSQKP